jgi:hypothetical protein
MISANTTKRTQAISIEGNVLERYFAEVSDVARKMVDSRISAMPRNGWSARAAARRGTGGFEGDGGADCVSGRAIGA